MYDSRVRLDSPMLFCVHEELVGHEPFAILLADDLMVGNPLIMAHMLEHFAQWPASLLAVQDVPCEHTKRYGIVCG